MNDDDSLYRCLKQMEISAQAALFSIPQPNSPAHAALNIPQGESWKVGQLIDALVWMHRIASKAATVEFMSGKE